jgi:histidinol-phosphate aminotransferase
MEKIYLDRNENTYGPAPACLEVLKEADKQLFAYYTDAYKRGVKSALSERLAEDFNIDEERVILGYGAEDILKQLVQCYLGPGQKLMVPAYSWWYYKEIANEVGGINIEYPLIKGEDSFHYDIDRMLSLINQEEPKLLFLSSPNNPTGNSISLEDLDKVLSNTRDTIIALDEAYWYKKDREHAIDLINKYPDLVVIRTFSKYFALAGIRIGYALIGESLTKLSKLANRYLGFNLLAEKIAIAALNSPDYYADITDKMDRDKELYYQELGKIKDFTVFKSDANFILVEIPAEIKNSLKQFLTNKGLIIKFMDEEALNSHLRITLGTQEENRKIIEAIKEFMSAESNV